MQNNHHNTILTLKVTKPEISPYFDDITFSDNKRNPKLSFKYEKVTVNLDKEANKKYTHLYTYTSLKLKDSVSIIMLFRIQCTA